MRFLKAANIGMRFDRRSFVTALGLFLTPLGSGATSLVPSYNYREYLERMPVILVGTVHRAVMTDYRQPHGPEVDPEAYEGKGAIELEVHVERVIKFVGFKGETDVPPVVRYALSAHNLSLPYESAVAHVGNRYIFYGHISLVRRGGSSTWLLSTWAYERKDEPPVPMDRLSEIERTLKNDPQ